MEQKCVFCAIIGKQVPAKVVYEDDNSIAVLDIAPRSTGMTLVIPKQHVKDFDENFDLSTKVFSSALTVAEMIKQSLNPLTIEFSIIPSEQLQHFHIRVYPVYENEVPLIENQPKKVSEEELDDVAEKIKAVKISLKKGVKEEIKEKPKERERSKEEIYWIKRATQLT